MPNRAGGPARGSSMGWPRNTPDVWPGLRRPASGPTEYYQHYQNGNITVGTAPVRLSEDRIICNSLLVRAGKTNAGRINFGGQNVSTLNGMELDAGEGIYVSTTDTMSQQQALRSQLANTSAMAELAGAMSPEEIVGVFIEPRIVLRLNDFFCVANLAAQNVRFFYTQVISTPGR